MKKSILLFLMIFCSFTKELMAQTFQIEGQVLDSKTGNIIPFASLQILGNSKNKGTVSDIRGWYRLEFQSENDSVRVSHVGFEKLNIIVSSLRMNPVITLQPITINLSEIQVRAGENPAIPIIKKVIDNKKLNDPDKLNTYSFKSYNKVVMTLDGLKESPEYDDSTAQILKGGHIFMAESYSEVNYKKPGKKNETVLASKMSGIENPLVAMASNSFQPFSFYTDHIKILEVPYVNPISNDGLRKYEYFLEDSIKNNLETTYIVAYQPKERKVHQLGKGLLYISDKQFAIENMTISPSDPDTNLIFEIQQKNQWNGEHWFPQQFNSIYLAPEMEFEGKGLKVINQTFISEVKINAQDNNTRFGPVSLNFDIQNDKYNWNDLRLDSLTTREYLTYVRFDQMDPKDKRKLNLLSKVLTQISSGRIPLGIVDLIPNRLLRFNRFEGVGLGLGLSSNETLSDFFRVEGYFRNGFRDKGWKYGGGLELNLDKKYDSRLKFNYSQDLEEPGRSLLPRSNSFSSGGDVFRKFIAERMDKVENYSVEFSQIPLKGTRIGVFGSVQDRNNILNFTDLNPTDGFPQFFRASEAGLNLRWTGNESLSRIGNNLISWAVSYPVISMRVSKAIPELFGGNVDFVNTEFRFQHQWNSGNSLNQFHISAHGIWGNNLPLSYLNTGYGINVGQRNAVDFALSFPGYLQTMFLYEFLSDRSLMASYAHQTGPLFRKKAGSIIFAPQLKFFQSFAIGTLTNPDFYDFVEFKTMEKGYWESGIELNNIIKQKSGLQFRGWGLGAFYRYGPYANPSFNDNLTITLSMTISF
ncbi:CarboxypepD_reg-like domain-containing protein [Aquiflexum balticum DSM 16537]|uniref:CarboxypepD_reg-like domain-containing protein n=1 Tax=Aquiflexum balticum DSM 16537 TaxID=758820 RepID=A0A1W2H4E7_9BACT|nr:DUF5686 family protein [Aquiflexum balticum]SMD43805.1 CarboxypepD_reg-like domain-containing protein [Aquiflexum balticum DSM 16537]